MWAGVSTWLDLDGLLLSCCAHLIVLYSGVQNCGEPDQFCPVVNSWSLMIFPLNR